MLDSIHFVLADKTWAEVADNVGTGLVVIGMMLAAALATKWSRPK